ncbi:MAG TPA: allantoinase AllB [Candidatus Acidoferrales bacterium]|nr:allantoinase AllB [Candidatus Acidoferrales bacterium]
MRATEIILRSRRVVMPNGVAPAAICVRDGKIEAVRGYEDVPAGAELEDVGELAVLPGIVDTHVHINEPGRAEWEGFETATRAAAAGGITTLVEMPLNSIPATTSVAAFREKCDAARGKLFVDTGFWGGVVPVNATNGEELRSLYDAGVFGFKCFLVPSGVDEFPCVTEHDLRAALPALAKLGALLLVHAELPGPIETAMATTAGKDPRKYATWLKSRPRDAENAAIALAIRLAKEFRARVHIVHLSSSDALPLLRIAKDDGVAITVETCPHYLFWKAEEIRDGATQFKCAPPIREEENRERLWGALRKGLFDLVATDHSPCPPAMKCGETGDFLRAWGGISSLQLSLPLMWTMASGRGFGLEQTAQWMCAGPARLAGLEERKGAIAAGRDADFVVFDPDAPCRVEPEQLHHRHKLTPYAGRELRGAVRATWLRGKKIYDGAFPAGASGEILLRCAKDSETTDEHR